MKALINYTFLLNPEQSWGNIDDFVKDFNEFLQVKGLRVEPILTVDKKDNIFEVCKIPEQSIEEKEPTVRQVKAKLTAKRDNKGKYLKS